MTISEIRTKIEGFAELTKYDPDGNTFESMIHREIQQILPNGRSVVVELLREWLPMAPDRLSIIAVIYVGEFHLQELKPELERLRENIKLSLDHNQRLAIAWYIDKAFAELSQLN